MELWYDQHGTYATATQNSVRKNYIIQTSTFRDWLQLAWMASGRLPVDMSALEQAEFTLAAIAKAEGTRQTAEVRVAEHEGNVYLDLCNDKWEAVKVTAQGWAVITDPPVKFVRYSGMLDLPAPQAGGSIDLLRNVINVARDEDFMLLVAWLVGALNPHGPYAILGSHGEQGTAKSTAAKFTRMLIDPNACPLRRPHQNVRDLFIAANNSRVCAYDNISGVSEELSNALCSIATGGGYGIHTNYSDKDETLFDVCRPIIFNGINEVANRPDLLDRCVAITLGAIPEEQRKRERGPDGIFTEFERVRSLVLGTLLDAVSVALRDRDSVTIDRLPRMADFAHWATAAVPAFGWKRGEFLDNYRGNVTSSTSVVLDDSCIHRPLLRLLDKCVDQWPDPDQIRSPEDLLEELNRVATIGERNLREWPTRGRTLAGMLRKLAPAFRKAGVFIVIGERQTTGRRIVPLWIGNGQEPKTNG
jgi:hypothetical protein